MIKITNFLLITSVIFFISCESNKEKNNQFDFSGMEQFIQIADVLENDREPTPGQWDELFSTPGYAVLTDGEFSREFFKERFRMVLMPSMKSDLDSVLRMEEDRAFHVRFIHHYNDVKNRMEEIEKYMEKLKSDAQDILYTSSKKAKNYLPPIDCDDHIPVSFLVFANDARGYTPIVIDMLFAIELGDLLPVLLAHEMHHFYRNKILAYDPQQVSDEDRGLVWVLDQIHCEGIADQIDKDKLISNEDGPLHFFAGQWQAMVENAPEYLSLMDSLLCEIDESPKDKENISLKLRRALPMSGHPVGFYMANVIIENNRKEDLINKAGNPFGFFRVYKDIAKKDDPPVFSKQAMRVIEDFENIYVKEMD